MKKKKVIFWGVITVSVIFVFNIIHGFLGGGHGRGRAGMGQAAGLGPQGGFGGHHQFMGGSHFGGGFPWLAVLIGLGILVLLVRWFRKKSKTSAMNEFLDTAFVSSQKPIMNQNATILDQWEKNVTNKKENE